MSSRELTFGLGNQMLFLLRFVVFVVFGKEFYKSSPTSPLCSNDAFVLSSFG